MLANPMTFARRPQGVLSRIVPDRRRHKRICVTLLGRFMRESKEEHPCKLIDISAGGAAVMSPVAVPVGERVVAYFDHIGGIEGMVVRAFDGGFAIKINATQHKREKLAAQLTWLANRSELVRRRTPPRARHAEERRFTRCSWRRASRSPAACSTYRSRVRPSPPRRGRRSAPR